MLTPWGDSDELRGQRLPPGAKVTGREATVRHQRARLFAATVAAAAERGYGPMTVADLLARSGVARADFYKLFTDKRECFLATADELYGLALQQVRSACRSGERWEDRVGGSIRGLLELLLAQPAAARLCTVSIYEAGAQGAARVDRNMATLERLLARVLTESRARSGLPVDVLAAIVGGLQMLIHDRLRRGAEDELRGCVDELIAWAVSYETPRLPLRRPQPARATPPSRPRARDETLLLAMAGTVAAKGYGATSVDELASGARTSLRTLYELWGGKEQAFLACFEMANRRGLEATEGRISGAPDWPHAVHAANQAVLSYLASEPDFARVAMVEVLAAGPTALHRRGEAAKPFVGMLLAGRRDSPQVPPIAAEAIAYGAYSLIRRQIVRHGPATLPRIGPTATFFNLAPYLGCEEAAAIANGR